MAARPSLPLEELLKDVPSEKLAQTCTDEHLNQLALSITDWQSISPFLGVSEAEVEEIDCQYPRKLVAQKVAMLRRWQGKFGRSATYRRLVDSLWHRRLTTLVEKICSLVMKEEEEEIDEDEFVDAAEDLPSHIPDGGSTSTATSATVQSHILRSYADYLRSRYQTEIPSFLTDQWPPPPTTRVFNLTMIRRARIRRGPVDEEFVRLKLYGRVKDILGQKKPVKLEEIFTLDKAKRKVILIEGAPGSGKSTLAWHICQKWESGELFQEFQVIIFIQLREPASQCAETVADLFPADCKGTTQTVLLELEACSGRNTLLILDSWDEFPPELHKGSILEQLIHHPRKLNLRFSTLLITSRPVATGDLQNNIVSSRIEILGFAPSEVKEYFTEALEEDEKSVEKLVSHLVKWPMIEASCYLPLNAAIVAHLFLALNQSLPTTLHGVFLSLVLCCIIRHMKKLGTPIAVSSFSDLPDCLRKPFNNICTLAYRGVMDTKATFSTEDLEAFKLPKEMSTLSLIQGVESFSSFDKKMSYNFLHLSIQELLASWHISKLPTNKQVEIFKELFGKPRFAVVFRFYAAFTKLETEGIQEILVTAVKSEMKKGFRDTKHILLYVLQGLYEVQEPSLCEFVASQLEGKLDVTSTTLSPVDCLAMGYFLSCVVPATKGEFRVNLSWCSLDDYRIGFIVRELLECSTSTSTSKKDTGSIDLDLWPNNVHGNGARSLGDLLKSTSPMLSKLNLSKNEIQKDTDGLSHLSQSLAENTSLVELRLSNCSLEVTEENGSALCHMLRTNQSLKLLELSQNEKISDRGARHIAEGLKENVSVELLGLEKCSITSEGAQFLGKALAVNRNLKTLNLNWNELEDDGIGHISNGLKLNRSLKALNITGCEIEARGSESLGSALLENGTLEVLHLSMNTISNGIFHIADALRRNCHLKKFHMQACGLTDQGITSVAGALETNTLLRELVLTNNPFSNDGLVALGESLGKNKGLGALGLRNIRKVTNEGLKQFIIDLSDNCHLLKLMLRQTAGGCLAVQSLVETLNKRRTEKGIEELQYSDCGHL